MNGAIPGELCGKCKNPMNVGATACGHCHYIRGHRIPENIRMRWLAKWLSYWILTLIAGGMAMWKIPFHVFPYTGTITCTVLLALLITAYNQFSRLPKVVHYHLPGER